MISATPTSSLSTHGVVRARPRKPPTTSARRKSLKDETPDDIPTLLDLTGAASLAAYWS